MLDSLVSKTVADAWAAYGRDCLVEEKECEYT